MSPGLNKLVLNISYTSQLETVSSQPCMIVFVRLCHAQAVSGVDDEHVGYLCIYVCVNELFGLFYDISTRAGLSGVSPQLTP